MNLLWMTLIAAMGLMLTSAMQFKNMRQDLWWQSLSLVYNVQKQETAHEFQRQQFHRLPREVAYLGVQISPASSDQDVNRADSSALPQLKKGALQRILLYPLNTRLPLSQKLYVDSNHAAQWQAAWWQLLDRLYGNDEDYRAWRGSVDTESFIKELLAQLKQIAADIQSAGTQGLSLVQFESQATQQIWYCMLRGSDRSGTCYPSLMGYVWPIEIVRSSTVSQRLNLPYANPVTIAALMGEPFAEQWLERCLQLKQQALEQHGRVSQPDKWLLTRQVYEDLFEEICRDLSIASVEVKPLLDFTAGSHKQDAEILLRNEGGIDQILTLQLPKRKVVN